MAQHISMHHFTHLWDSCMGDPLPFRPHVNKSTIIQDFVVKKWCDYVNEGPCAKIISIQCPHPKEQNNGGGGGGYWLMLACRYDLRAVLLTHSHFAQKILYSCCHAEINETLAQKSNLTYLLEFNYLHRSVSFCFQNRVYKWTWFLLELLRVKKFSRGAYPLSISNVTIDIAI